MTPAELLTLFRQQQSDEAQPYLWSDAEAYEYATDAQRMFCRLTDGIADSSTASVTRLTIAIGADWVNLHKSIKLIRSAHLVSTGAPVEIINADDMPARGIRFDGKTGPVRSLIVGMEENRARVYPVASEADAIQLSVFRLPINVVSQQSQLEIGEQHHRHLVLWMRALAYGKHDSETFDQTKRDEFAAEFRAYCEQAEGEQRDKRRKVRVVAYGGI